MALSDMLNIGSSVLGFASMANPALAPVSIGLSTLNSFAQSWNPDNRPKRLSPLQIRTGDPLVYEENQLLSNLKNDAFLFEKQQANKTVPKIDVNYSYDNPEMGREALLKTGMRTTKPDESTGLFRFLFAGKKKVGEEMANLANIALERKTDNINKNITDAAVNWNEDFVEGGSHDDPLEKNPWDATSLVPDLKTTNPTGIAKTFADVKNLNKVSAGLSAVGAVGSLINEFNAKPPRFAPVSKASRVNLDSDTSAFENASQASTDKLYRSTLSSLINRGLSPVMANAVAGSIKNNASNETLAKAEQFRTQTKNQEAGINAEVSARNAAAINQHNQYKESMQAEYNKMAGQNISSSLATLAQIPAGYAGSLMGAEMFKHYLSKA